MVNFQKINILQFSIDFSKLIWSKISHSSDLKQKDDAHTKHQQAQRQENSSSITDELDEKDATNE